MASMQKKIQRLFQNRPSLNKKVLQMKKSWEEATGIVTKMEKKGKK
jgi:hypothetical protein